MPFDALVGSLVGVAFFGGFAVVLLWATWYTSRLPPKTE